VGVIYVLTRALFTYGALMLITRVMGQKQVAQLTFPNYVVGITIGSIAATLATDSSVPMWEGVAALFVWATMPILTDLFTLRNRTARAVLEGEPVVVVHKGKILDRKMRRIRYNHNELLAQMRNLKIFDPEQVEYAVLETDGRLSVLLKQPYLPATKADVGSAVQSQSPTLPAEVIVDGTVYHENLQGLGRDHNWLHKQLVAGGFTDPSELSLGVVQTDGTLYMSPKGQPESERQAKPPL